MGGKVPWQAIDSTNGTNPMGISRSRKSEVKTFYRENNSTVIEQQSNTLYNISLDIWNLVEFIAWLRNLYILNYEMIYNCQWILCEI